MPETARYKDSPSGLHASRKHRIKAVGYKRDSGKGKRVSGCDRSRRWSMAPRTRGRLDHSADDIDAHGQDCDVEYERKNAMDQGDPAHVASDDGDVRNLRGHAHHERVIHEVEVIGFRFPRKAQAANMFLRRLLAPVVATRIVKREKGMDQQPREQEGANRKRETRGAFRQWELFGVADKKANGDDAGARCDQIGR